MCLVGSSPSTGCHGFAGLSLWPCQVFLKSITGSLALRLNFYLTTENHPKRYSPKQKTRHRNKIIKGHPSPEKFNTSFDCPSFLNQYKVFIADPILAAFCIMLYLKGFPEKGLLKGDYPYPYNICIYIGLAKSYAEYVFENCLSILCHTARIK